MPLTQDEIKRLRELKAEGVHQAEIARQFGVAPGTVRYHTDPEYRKNRLERDRIRYRDDPEYRKKMLEKKRIRDRIRYRDDPEYRKKMLEKKRIRYHTDPEYRKNILEKKRIRETNPEFYHFVEFTKFVQQHSDFMEMLQSEPEKYKGCLSLFGSDEFMGTIYSLYVDNISNDNYCREILSYLNGRTFGAKSINIKKDLSIERGLSWFFKYVKEHKITEKDDRRYILTDFGKGLLKIIETYSAEKI